MKHLHIESLKLFARTCIMIFTFKITSYLTHYIQTLYFTISAPQIDFPNLVISL